MSDKLQAEVKALSDDQLVAASKGLNIESGADAEAARVAVVSEMVRRGITVGRPEKPKE